MHVGGVPATCRAPRGEGLCGAVLWVEDERLEPIEDLIIGVASCLRCGAAFIYARWPNGVARTRRDDDDA